MAETRRLRILQSSFVCLPDHGSEPGTGWNRAFETARHFDTWVLTSTRPALTDWLAHNRLPPGLTFVGIPLGRIERGLLPVPLVRSLAYRRWQRRALAKARELHARIGFDVAHQHNITGFREPGYLWRLDLPFVWGPVGGTQNFPWRFLAVAGFPGALTEAARNIINALQLRFSPLVRRALRRAWLVTPPGVGARDFARIHGVQAETICDTGVTALGAARQAREPGPVPLRILWCGILEPRKGLPLLLGALRTVRDDLEFELRILGDGGQRGRLGRMAGRYGIAGSTRFLGRLPLSAVLAEYARADVFVFTSLRDATGTVVLEALSSGLPVICLDHQGCGVAVTDRSGIKVPVTDPKTVMRDLGAALRRLAADPGLLASLSAGARERARDYLWSRNGEQMADLIRRAAAGPPPPRVRPER